jgi:flagellar biosynthesis protein FlhG
VHSEPKDGVFAQGNASALWPGTSELSAAGSAAVLDLPPSAEAPSTGVASLSRQDPKPALRARGRIIAVGGGKGGVGKSLVTSSLGISLARHGRKVVLVDADLGGANLHTCLGLSTPDRTLSDFINRRVGSIEDAIVETGVPNLGLISGAHDHLTASNLKYFQKTRLLSRISQVDADVILLDIGAGISFNIVDFFLIAEQGILVVIPEPSSIENAYRFLKMSFYRHLWRSLKASPARNVVEQAMDQKNTVGIRTPFDLLESVERIDAASGRFLKEQAQSFRPRLLVNQVRYPEDERLGHSMAAVCRKHLGVDIEAIGAVSFDESVWRANRKKRPFLLDFPESVAGRSLEQVARALLFNAPSPTAATSTSNQASANPTR